MKGLYYIRIKEKELIVLCSLSSNEPEPSLHSGGSHERSNLLRVDFLPINSFYSLGLY